MSAPDLPKISIARVDFTDPASMPLNASATSYSTSLLSRMVPSVLRVLTPRSSKALLPSTMALDILTMLEVMPSPLTPACW